ncbi:uncharacterized protein TNCV_4047391 [Trichonephila clavipes]|nr:uncharacterized protein TNCV_4047391 [Trichonephila clavipes]
MFKSILITVLLVAVVICQEEGCGLFKKKCKENQYCYRPDLNLELDLGVCLNYMKKGAFCDERLRCEPPLECKVATFGLSVLWTDVRKERIVVWFGLSCSFITLRHHEPTTLL